MTTILFKEIQKFRQVWLWLLIVFIDSMIFYGLYQQFVLQKPFGDNPMSNEGLIITAVLILCFTAFFMIMQLRTSITEKGIELQFFPIHHHKKTYSWHEISEVYIREYKALREYGGWGIRTGAYNVSGNKGLQLIFKNGEKLLIGTNQPDELENVILSLKQKQIIASKVSDE